MLLLLLLCFVDPGFRLQFTSPPSNSSASANHNNNHVSGTPVFLSGSTSRRQAFVQQKSQQSTDMLDFESGRQGWDCEFVPKPDNKYECPICLFVLRDPTQTSCGHRFCNDCIKQWLRYCFFARYEYILPIKNTSKLCESL